MVDKVCWLHYYIRELGEDKGREYYDRRFKPLPAGTIVSDGRITEIKK
jgi:hypothetical protein